MVSWVDRGLDLEKKRGGGQAHKGDNAIQMVWKWLMPEKEQKKWSERKDLGISERSGTLYYVLF